ncbi:MAG: patatin-like phospholipase family protein [Bacillota bacterium]|nr:patatin-like phospholipase family protein [Bacillota bacterium]
MAEHVVPHVTEPEVGGPVPPPRIALALGSGSIRGGAHLGVLQVLEEHGLEPDLVTGSSAGALVGALWAGGLDARQVEERLRRLAPVQLLDMSRNPLDLAYIGSRVLLEALGVQSRWMRPSPSGLATGLRFERWLRENLPVLRFEELPRRLAVVACDLLAGTTVVLTGRRWLVAPAGGRGGRWGRGGSPAGAEGALPDQHELVAASDVAAAVRASSSIPWLYTPKRLGGRVLVDGGVGEPVPAPAARLLGARLVIAVDLGSVSEPPGEVRGIARILGRSAEVAGRHLARWQLAATADLVLRPALPRAGLTEVEALPAMVEAGRAEAERRLPEIEALFRRARRMRL